MHGGPYVPETVMNAVLEVEEALVAALDLQPAAGGGGHVEAIAVLAVDEDTGAGAVVHGGEGRFAGHIGAAQLRSTGAPPGELIAARGEDSEDFEAGEHSLRRRLGCIKQHIATSA